MYDLAEPNERPGQCRKCKGTGVYRWGNKQSGPCYSCRGTGIQSNDDIKRNCTYNQHKVARILSGDLR